MSDKLIFNPFLEIHLSDDEEADFLLFAPKPNDSFKRLEIKRSKNENLYKLLTEYSGIGVQYIDLSNDLTADDIELFREFGFLITEEQKIERTLFSCQLDEVEESDLDLDFSDLIVNPTFHFEPFNLANFRKMIFENHFSPHQATAYIKSHVTEIELGYWLNPKQAEIIANFQKGEKFSDDLDKEFLTKLVSAKILVNPKALEDETRRLNKIIEESRDLFNENKYVLVEKLLPKEHIKAMQSYYKTYISQGFMEFGDNQVDKRFRKHNEPVAKRFHNNLTQLMSLITGKKVIPSYCYAASYLTGAELKPHRDRDQCEFSISFQVDYEPTQTDEKSPWELYLTDPIKVPKGRYAFDWEEFNNSSDLLGEPKSMNLANGDGLFYKGCELIHYRYSLPENHKSTSLFFHFVAEDFQGDLA